MQTYEIKPAGITDIGNVRPTNEDYLLAEGDLFVVADGMGGEGRGEAASRTAVQTIREAFTANPSTTGLTDAVHQANRAVWERSEAEPALHGMGTTIAAVGVVNDDDETRLVIANVGDSRVYLLRAKQLSRLSSDHSLVADLVRSGEISEEEAHSHPERHVLTRAVGVGPETDPYVALTDPAAGDRLLVCSDGLFNELGNDEIADILATVTRPEDAASQLVARAKEHGGNDNITAIVLDIRAP